MLYQATGGSMAISQKNRGKYKSRIACCITARLFFFLVAPPTAVFSFHPAIPIRNQHEPSCLLNNGAGHASLCVSTTSPLRGRLRQGALAAGGAEGNGDSGVFYTPADLDAYSAPWGITLHYTGTLNTYRIEAHRPNGEVAGYTTGFYVGDYLHLDKVQVGGCPSGLRCTGLRGISCYVALSEKRPVIAQCYASRVHRRYDDVIVNWPRNKLSVN